MLFGSRVAFFLIREGLGVPMVGNCAGGVAAGAGGFGAGESGGTCGGRIG